MTEGNSQEHKQGALVIFTFETQEQKRVRASLKNRGKYISTPEKNKKASLPVKSVVMMRSKQDSRYSDELLTKTSRASFNPVRVSIRNPLTVEINDRFKGKSQLDEPSECIVMGDDPLFVFLKIYKGIGVRRARFFVQNATHHKSRWRNQTSIPSQPNSESFLAAL